MWGCATHLGITCTGLIRRGQEIWAPDFKVESWSVTIMEHVNGHESVRLLSITSEREPNPALLKQSTMLYWLVQLAAQEWVFSGAHWRARSSPEYGWAQFTLFVQLLLCCHCCSLAKLCPTLCSPTDSSTLGSSLLHCLPVCSDSCPWSQWGLLTI